MGLDNSQPQPLATVIGSAVTAVGVGDGRSLEVLAKALWLRRDGSGAASSCTFIGSVTSEKLQLNPCDL